MFEFAFYAAIMLIASMIATHYYFADKIKHNINKAREEWCKEVAKFNVERLKRFIETYGQQATPPYDKLEEFYTDLYKKELETVDVIVSAERPSRWLDDSLKCFISSIILFFVAGVLSLPQISLSEYSVPTLLVGSLMVIVAALQIYRVTKAL